MMMSSALAALLSAKGRTTLYSVGFAIIGLLGVYGVLSTEQQAAWAAVLLAALGMAPVVLTHITPDTPAVDEDV
jgi:drug/metabolite transporter (DMT)-like permease